jgi:hypothetical protein
MNSGHLEIPKGYALKLTDFRNREILAVDISSRWFIQAGWRSRVESRIVGWKIRPVAVGIALVRLRT